MENEILEVLKNIQGSIIEIQKEQKMTNERLIKLEEGQQRIENKIDITYDQLARTAEDITDIKKDLIFVEEATSKNWNDIAKLKAIK